MTRTGDNLGTPRYMSPEQAGGRREPLDWRTDIYSLGVTLYELLTLQPAFDGDDRITLLRRIVEEEAAAPRRINLTIPRDLETIVLKAMAKEPAHRYATAHDLADDLRRFLDDRPIRAKRPTVQERAAKWARRNRSVMAAGIVAVLVIVAALTSVGVWSIVWLQRHNTALRREVQRADANALMARRHLVAVELRRSNDLLEAGHIGRAQDVLDGLEANGDDEETRGFAWRYLSRLARRDIIQLRVGNRKVVGWAISRDGQTIVVEDSEARIDLWDMSTLMRRGDLTGTAIYATSPNFSPDGTKIAAVEWDRPSHNLKEALGAVVWDAASGRILTRIPKRQSGGAVHWADFVSSHAVGLFEVDDLHRFNFWSVDPDRTAPRKLGSYIALNVTWPMGGMIVTRVGSRLRLMDVDSGAASRRAGRRVRVLGTRTVGRLGGWPTYRRRLSRSATDPLGRRNRSGARSMYRRRRALRADTLRAGRRMAGSPKRRERDGIPLGPVFA